MTSVLLVGAGAVGGRAARQLAETAGVSRVLLADRDEARVETVVRAVGDPVVATSWTTADPLPDGVDAVACATPAPLDRTLAERCVDRRIPLASVSDDAATTRRLLDLHDAAAEAGTVVAVGCGLAPGLSDVLARHASDALTEVDEVHVARFGTSGAACAAQLHASSTGPAREWRDGAWAHVRAGSGRQLVWFPDPVGAVDCFRVESGQPTLLVDTFPTLRRSSFRVAARRLERLGARLPARRSSGEGGYGAVWVEVRGTRGTARELVVYGVVDRMAIATGTVLAVTAAALCGAAGPGLEVTAVGAHGLGSLLQPVPFLSELARRGVKVAVYDGSAAA